MRLWSIHPGYLDSKGLVALWREGLLAQNVLLGKTKGYKNHPQLSRFKNADNSEAAIASYLRCVADEADKRNYKFDRDKISKNSECSRLQVTEGQLEYEFKHLLNKLKVRDPSRHEELKSIKQIETHPLFTKTEGGIEEWEVIHQAAT
ncbi:pyrimidine dimer DNA glycosylase/endonuclease V [Candidatus Nitrotoga sp. M5]|uniref:pyrimidine dimer DNA glycosylase/endonuclease V n=1 Tax=Candidatus Nitrotoga sp. M5 TaxID=2890409 RepID=UPI001EF3A2CB|nr:pyrimidine dimer DNA glycosylase/endonuclease V [Candidatus Nitrotoga sp. M5]CAH1385339.1 DNA lyase [Candidatus Nitrotoga sp. M5]